jgi:hypothetical protein
MLVLTDAAAQIVGSVIAALRKAGPPCRGTAGYTSSAVVRPIAGEPGDGDAGQRASGISKPSLPNGRRCLSPW